MKNEVKIPLNHIFFSFPRVNENKVEEVLSLDQSGELYKELLSIFSSEFIEKLPLLKESLDKENYFELSELSHRLRSTSYNVGAIRTGEILKKIEVGALGLAEDINKEELSVLVDSVKLEQQESLKALLTYTRI